MNPEIETGNTVQFERKAMIDITQWFTRTTQRQFTIDDPRLEEGLQCILNDNLISCQHFKVLLGKFTDKLFPSSHLRGILSTHVQTVDRKTLEDNWKAQKLAPLFQSNFQTSRLASPSFTLNPPSWSSFWARSRNPPLTRFETGALQGTSQQVFPRQLLTDLTEEDWSLD